MTGALREQKGASLGLEMAVSDHVLKCSSAM